MQMQTKKVNKQIGVVAGILEQNNQYLLCQRPKGKICENFWEFPGGKIEPNETPLDAICRELSEELKITINRKKTYFWFCKDFVYRVIFGNEYSATISVETVIWFKVPIFIHIA